MSAPAEPASLPALRPVRAPSRRWTDPAALGVALGAALVAALLPLLLTPVLPIRDGYLHAVRYLVLSGLPLPPALEASYAADWRLLPNLGLDVAGAGLMRVLEPLSAMRVLGALAILAPLGGVLALSAALHGRPTLVAALAGGVLAINHITIWGFTNFLVGLGLALGGLALWIALAARPRAQLLAALLLGPPLLMVHGLAFALWGLGLGAIEIAAAWQTRRAGGLAPLALAQRLLRLLLLAVGPVLLWARMPTSGEGAEMQWVEPVFHRLSGWEAIRAELLRRFNDTVLSVGETGWDGADILLGTALWTVLAWGIAKGGLRLHPLVVPATFGWLVLTLLMPSYFLGVRYVTDRLPLVLLCVLAAGLSPAAGHGKRTALTVTSCLAVICIADGLLTAASWYRQGRHYAAFTEGSARLPAARTVQLMHLDAAGKRGGGSALACAPLAPLLTLAGIAAAPTFANPTQQPLRLSGPLAEAVRSAGRWDNPTQPDGVTVAASLEAGFDLVISCAGRRSAMEEPMEGRILRRGRNWLVIANPALSIEVPRRALSPSTVLP